MRGALSAPLFFRVSYCPWPSFFLTDKTYLSFLFDRHAFQASSLVCTQNGLFNDQCWLCHFEMVEGTY